MTKTMPFMGRMRAVTVTHASLSLAGIDPMIVSTIQQAETEKYTGWEEAKRTREAIFQAIAFGDIKAISATVFIPRNSFGDGEEELVDPSEITTKDLPFLVEALLVREDVEAWFNQDIEADEVKPNSDGIPRHNLVALSSALEDLKSKFGIELSNGAAIAHDILLDEAETLYLDNSETGLWHPVPVKSKNQLINDFCFSEYVISNGRIPAKGWLDWMIPHSTVKKLNIAARKHMQRPKIPDHIRNIAIDDEFVSNKPEFDPSTATREELLNRIAGLEDCIHFMNLTLPEESRNVYQLQLKIEAANKDIKALTEAAILKDSECEELKKEISKLRQSHSIIIDNQAKNNDLEWIKAFRKSSKGFDALLKVIESELLVIHQGREPKKMHLQERLSNECKELGISDVGKESRKAQGIISLIYPDNLT